MIPLLGIPLAFGGEAALASLLALLAPRRLAGVLLAGVLALPWAIPPALVTLRGAAAMFAVVLFMRGIDLLRERSPRPALERVVHLFTVADLRLAQAVPPRLDARLLGTGLLCGAAAPALLVGAALAHPVWAAGALLQRWGLGLAGFYLLFEGVDRLARTIFLLGGARVEPTQRAPIAARTLAELWGVRWNAIVRRWLASVAFVPLARHGRARLGGLLAFVVSAAIHFYIVLAPLGGGPAAEMGAFFLLQGGLVTVERALGVARWPVLAARAWTVVGILLPMPLFLEPLLRVLGLAALR